MAFPRLSLDVGQCNDAYSRHSACFGLCLVPYIPMTTLPFLLFFPGIGKRRWPFCHSPSSGNKNIRLGPEACLLWSSQFTKVLKNQFNRYSYYHAGRGPQKLY